tara:strand:- start:689 stop:1351 length:663 start_codon:yes stop_codon:yes gene_type:complete
MAQSTLGASMLNGENNNGLSSYFTEDERTFGGEDPSSVVKSYNATSSSSGGEVTIIIGGSFGGNGGNISSVLSTKLKEMLNNYVQPFVNDDISGTVQANINSTLYLTTLSDFGAFAPTVGTDQSEWTDNQLISSFALSTIGVVNRGLLLYLDNEDLQVQVAIIADQIRNELSPKLISQQAGIMINITTSATIDLRYVFYVEKYGPPIGGIFDPIKLAEFA